MRLMVTHRDISASEAASRLDLHIKTAQDFLEELCALGIASKEEVYERKRPYYRYRLVQTRLNIEVDFTLLYSRAKEKTLLGQKIREKKNSGAMFTTSESQSMISAVTIFTGEGRKKRERKINLTTSQGKFLYYLPFPSAAYETIRSIIKKAGTGEIYTPEILDMVDLLSSLNVIEFMN